jgi:hypothetical protein
MCICMMMNLRWGTATDVCAPALALVSLPADRPSDECLCFRRVSGAFSLFVTNGKCTLAIEAHPQMSGAHLQKRIEALGLATPFDRSAREGPEGVSSRPARQRTSPATTLHLPTSSCCLSLSLSVSRLVRQGSSVSASLPLSASGLSAGSTVSVMPRLLGGGCDGFSFVDLASNKGQRGQWAKTAPEYLVARPGLGLFGQPGEGLQAARRRRRGGLRALPMRRPASDLLDGATLSLSCALPCGPPPQARARTSRAWRTTRTCS